MASNLREVFVEIYLNGEFYRGDSCWVPDEQGVELVFEITDAIYDLFGADPSAQIHLELEVETDDLMSVSYSATEGTTVKVVSDKTYTTSVCECQKKEKQLETDPAGPSAEESSSGVDASLEASKNRPTGCTNGLKKTIGTFFKMLFQKDPTFPEASSPEPEPEMDLVDLDDKSSLPGPSSSEPEDQEVDVDDAISDLKSPALVSEGLAESAGPSTEVSGSSSGMDASPETPENSPKESTNGWMMNKIGAFFNMFFWRDPAVPEPVCVPDASSPEQTSEMDLVPSVPEMEPEFDRADPEESCVPVPSIPEMEPEFDQADPEESCVLVPSIPEMEPDLDLADPEQLCVPVPSVPEPESELESEPDLLFNCHLVPSVPQLDLVNSVESCVPGPSGAVPKPYAGTSKQDPFPDEECSQLYSRVKACTLSYKSVTKVWNNIFIGNEETARDRMTMKELGITHILNAAAMKKKLRIFLGIIWDNDVRDTVDTGASYYRGMKIRYRGLPISKTSNIRKYFLPAAKFIHKARKNSENKVFIHCTDGVNYAPTLFLAYLMIYHNMTVEDAIDYLVKVKYIEPDVDFLRQLAILNEELKNRSDL